MYVIYNRYFPRTFDISNSSTLYRVLRNYWKHSHFINFKGSRVIIGNAGKIEIDGVLIEEKKTVTFLGVVINEFLTWDDHITKI